jgi:cold shock CspA family protein
VVAPWCAFNLRGYCTPRTDSVQGRNLSRYKGFLLMAITGIVKNIAADGGHGFIKRTDGPDVFLDLNEAGLDSAIMRGQRLIFDVVDKGRGPRAVNVKRPPSVETPRLNSHAAKDRARYRKRST